MATRNMRDMQNRHRPSSSHTQQGDVHQIKNEAQLGKEQQAQFNTFKKMAKQYEGKSQDQLMAELKQVAAQQRQSGHLDNKKLEEFKQTIGPMLDAQQSQKLNSILSMLKR